MNSFFRLSKPNLINYTNYFFLFLCIIIVEIAVVYFLKDYSPYLLILFNVFLIIWIVQLNSDINIITLFIIFNLIPLVYLNNVFHYTLKWTALQDIPLFILFIVAILTYALNEKTFSISFNGLKLPLIIFAIYSVFSFFVGVFNGNNFTFVLDELYHFFYYPFAFIIYYLVRNRKDYLILFLIIIGIATVVAIQYIVFQNLFHVARLVTFQSGIFLLPISFLLASILIHKIDLVGNLIRKFLFIIICYGLFITLTRSLWISALFSILIVFIFYQGIIRNVGLRKVVLFFSLIFIPVFAIVLNSSFQQTSKTSSEQIEYRAKSLSNPIEDVSLLMRLELGYYIYQKFIESPIIGKGLGDDVRYKILSQNDAFINYPDSSWLYFLWKGGLVGILIYLWLFVMMFRESIYVLRNSDNKITKIISLSILGTLSGLFIYSQFTAFLIKYKSNIIFPIIIAFLMFERKKIREKIIGN